MADHGANIGVLVADDDPLVLELVDELLRDADGLRCVGLAHDGLEAVSLAARHQPDVALLDVRMPSGGGAAVRAVLDVSPATVVLALSSHEHESLVLDMLHHGARGYLLKGAPELDLVESIRAAVRGEAPLAGTVATTVVDQLRSMSSRVAELVDRTDRLELAKEEFIQILAHELLTPTTVMQASADTVGRFATGDVAVLRELADRTASAAHRLRRIVDNLSLAAHLRDADWRPTVTRTRVRELLDAAWEAAAGEEDAVEVDCDDRLEIETDPALMTRALGLVLENAADHADRVEVSVETEDGMLTVCVRDDGPGFPEGFESGSAFVQGDGSTTRPHGGLGIGLYLTRLIMDRIDGQLETGPGSGGGAEVRLVVPGAGIRSRS